MFRRTKIVTTLGPATDDSAVLEKLILAGADVVRMNFSHGSAEDHKNRAELVRELAKKHGRHVGILGDLQGPKIRIARFSDGPVMLAIGDEFIIDASLERDAGNQTQVGTDYKELPEDVEQGDILLVDDGRVELRVTGIDGVRVATVCTVAGKLSNNKGINLKGGGLSAPALTEKDMDDIKTAAEIGVDYLAVSFPRSADDIKKARQMVRAAGGGAHIVAKIERAETVYDRELLDDIIRASDVVMVARGDLGVEIGDEHLIATQKHIIKRARTLNRVVITATQMMESMITAPLPTRAEVFDVANAVFDGTDAVMLSAETAAGDFPVQTVEAMARIIQGAEEHPESVSLPEHALGDYQSIPESVAMAAMHTANQMSGVKVIASVTESGRSPLLLSRYGSKIPIFAFSKHMPSLCRAALFRGVETVEFDNEDITSAEISRRVIGYLKDQNIVKDGDFVVLSKGDANILGGTNTMKILQVGQPILG